MMKMRGDPHTESLMRSYESQGRMTPEFWRLSKMRFEVWDLLNSIVPIAVQGITRDKCGEYFFLSVMRERLEQAKSLPSTYQGARIRIDWIHEPDGTTTRT